MMETKKYAKKSMYVRTSFFSFFLPPLARNCMSFTCFRRWGRDSSGSTSSGGAKPLAFGQYLHQDSKSSLTSLRRQVPVKQLSGTSSTTISRGQERPTAACAAAGGDGCPKSTGGRAYQPPPLRTTCCPAGALRKRSATRRRTPTKGSAQAQEFADRMEATHLDFDDVCR
jgi:hypothetical protein